MNVLDLPFNKFIGMKKADKSDYLLMLESNEHYENHLSTVHASAQFALAEASGGLFLLSEFEEIKDIVPVVRKVETKYSKPVTGNVYSRATLINTDHERVIYELQTRKRTLLTVSVTLYDMAENQVMKSNFEWFIAKNG